MPSIAKLISIFSGALGIFLIIGSYVMIGDFFNNHSWNQISFVQLLAFLNIAIGILLIVGGREIFRKKNWARILLVWGWVLILFRYFVLYLFAFMVEILKEPQAFYNDFLRDKEGGLGIIVLLLLSPIIIFILKFIFVIIFYLLKNQELRNFTNQ